MMKHYACALLITSRLIFFILNDRWSARLRNNEINEPRELSIYEL